MDKKIIDILKKVQAYRDNSISADFESLQKDGYDKGIIKSMITQDLLNWGGVLSLTEKGEKTLQNYLLLEKERPKQGVIFDNNFYNYLVDGKESNKTLENISNQFEVYITHIQYDEMNNCQDSEKRLKMNLFNGVLRPKVIPTSSFVVGTSRLGHGCLGNGEILEKIRESNPKHTNDALIGETAIKNNLLLITNDNRLKKKVLELGGQTKTVSEFLAGVQNE